MRVRSCCFRLDFSSFNNGNSRTCNARCNYAFEGAPLVELENILCTSQGSLIREKVNNTIRENAWSNDNLLIIRSITKYFVQVSEKNMKQINVNYWVLGEYEVAVLD